MREKILECLGTFPEKTNLNLIELESIDKESYIQKLIEYNVEEDIDKKWRIKGIATK